MISVFSFISLLGFEISEIASFTELLLPRTAKIYDKDKMEIISDKKYVMNMIEIIFETLYYVVLYWVRVELRIVDQSGVY